MYPHMVEADREGEDREGGEEGERTSKLSLSPEDSLLMI